MGVLRISVKVEGSKQVVAMLDTRGKRARNLRTPMTEIGKYMLDIIDDNFDVKGKVWERWKRPAHNYGHPLLEATGRMRNSFQARVRDNSVTISNKMHYFKYHQSKAPRKRLPRRIVMDFQEPQRRKVTKIIQAYIMEGM